MRRILCCGVLVAALTALAEPLSFTVVMDHTNCLYRCGEEAVFTVTASEGGRQATKGTVSLKVDNFGKKVFQSRTVDLAKENPFIVKGTKDIPGFLRLTIKQPGPKEFVWSVGYEPEKLAPGSACPADFDAFWADAVKKLDETVPLDARMERFGLMCDAKRNVYYVNFATVGGRRVWGLLSEPKDLSKGPFPVRINVPGAGPAQGFVQGDDTFIGLTMNVHYYPTVPGCGRQGVGTEPVRALHQAQNDEWQRKYGTRGYQLSGIAKGREDYFYYGALLGINRAINWLASRPECDRTNFTYGGTSQGGGFGFMLTALNKNITRAAIYVPAITDLCGFRQDDRMSGWPRLIEAQADDEKAAAEKWAPYYDGAHFAARITVPIRVVVGFADCTCPPCAVYSAYNAIPSKDKAIFHGFGMGHSVFADFYRRIGAWQAGE